jgi:hypothetical protein
MYLLLGMMLMEHVSLSVKTVNLTYRWHYITSIRITPLHAAQALSMFQSILLSHGQSLNHDDALYISNYYIINI